MATRQKSNAGTVAGLAPRDPMPVTGTGNPSPSRPAPQSGEPLTKAAQTNKGATANGTRKKAQTTDPELLELERKMKERKDALKAAKPQKEKAAKPEPVIYTGPTEETALVAREELLPVIESAGELEKSLSVTISKIANASDEVLRDMNTTALTMERYGFRVRLAVAYEAFRRAAGEWSKHKRQHPGETGPEKSVSFWQEKKARAVGVSVRNLTLRAKLHEVFFTEQDTAKEDNGDRTLPEVAAAANYLGSVEWLTAAQQGVKSTGKAREYLLRLAKLKQENDADIMTGKEDKPFLPEQGKKLVSEWKTQDGVSQTRSDTPRPMDLDLMLEEVRKVRSMMLENGKKKNEDGTFNGLDRYDVFVYFDREEGDWVSSPEHPGGDYSVMTLAFSREIKKEIVTRRDGTEEEKTTAKVDITPLFESSLERPGDYLDADGEEVSI